MYKIHIKGNLFYIDDLTTTLRYEGHAKSVLPRVLGTSSDEFSFSDVNNWSESKVIRFGQIDLAGAEYTDVESFIDWYETNTGKSSPSDGGGGNPTDGYNPTVTVSDYDDEVKINETNNIVITGDFLDYVDNITFTGSDLNGVTVNEVSKSFNELVIELTSNSTEQDLVITLESPNNNVNVTVSVVINTVIIPSNNGDGLSLWYRNPNPNNNATLTDGGFFASTVYGDGWNEHGAYGGFQNFTRLTHKMTITNITNPQQGYCYVTFTDNKEPSTIGYPSLYLNGGSMRILGNNEGLLAQSVNVQVGDEITIIQEPNTFVVLRNGGVVGAESVPIQDSIIYVSFTAYHTTGFNNINTTVEE